jgi:hypothetical protein
MNFEHVSRASGRAIGIAFSNLFISGKLTPMANMNFRGSYPFEELTSVDPTAGGLPGLLQEAMRRQNLQSALLAPDDPSQAPQPSMAPEPRVLPTWLRTDQLTQPLSSNSADSDLGSARDSNFRQLVSRPQSGAGRLSGGKSLSTSAPLDRVAMNIQSAGLGGRPADSSTRQPPKDDSSAADLIPVASWPSIRGRDLPLVPRIWPQPRDEDVAAMWKAIKQGWENFTYRLNPNAPTTSDHVPGWPACIWRPGLGVTSGQPIWPALKQRDAETSQGVIGSFHPPDEPVMPTGPASIPGESSPGDLTAESLAKQFPGIFTRRSILSGEASDPECAKIIKKAREECSEAFANDWKGTPHLGPYKNPDGSPWDVSDCARGIIPERCRPQGNPVTHSPPPKVKRFNLRPRRKKKKMSAFETDPDEASG